MKTPATQAHKPKGRPAKTSREEIVEFAFELLNADPDKELSFNRLAKTMGYTPMALYRYFDDKNDLQQAIARRVLANIEMDLSVVDSWREQICLWARTLRNSFLQYPYMIRYTGWQGHVAGSWLDHITELTEVFLASDIPASKHPIAVKWFSTTVMSLIHSEIVEQQNSVRMTPEDLSAQTAASTSRIVPVLKKIATTPTEEVFEFHLLMAVSTIEQLK